MRGSLVRFVASALAVVLALVHLPALAAASGARDGGSMLGVAPAASQAPGVLPACARPDAVVASAADEDEFEIDLEELEALGILDEIEFGRLLAQVPPAAPPAPPAPRTRATPAPAPAPEARAARMARRARVVTDTTLTVKKGGRFELHNFGGEIRIATWAKDAVRVQAEHSHRDWIDVKRAEGLLRVQSASRLGPSQSVEYKLTIPAWLPVQLSGVYNDVTAEGLQGGLIVETVRGDIAVRRAQGAIELRSVEGLVDLADASGVIRVSSVNDAVRLMKVGGSIQAEAVNGDIQLVDLASPSVEATTVNGAVLFDGKMLDGGSYRFSTHSGDIAVGLSDRSNATVTVSTYSGDFDTSFPIRLTRKDKGKRFEFVVGNGKADVELESFQGAIQLYTPGDKVMLRRFAESWRESERERREEMKWMWKFDHDHQHERMDDEDEDEDPTPPPPKKKGK